MLLFFLPISVVSLTVVKAKSSLCLGQWLLYQQYVCMYLIIFGMSVHSCMSLIFSPPLFCLSKRMTDSEAAMMAV